MPDELERGQFEEIKQKLDPGSSPAASHSSLPAVPTRPRPAGMSANPDPDLPGQSASSTDPDPTGQTSKPWDFLKRISHHGHSGWLITTLVFILVVAMSLSFGFVKGWLDPRITLTASIVFLVLLFAAMLVAHWPSRHSS